jgi:Ca2+-binding RTX toxin-like protein
MLTVFAPTLLSDEQLIFNGSAETNGTFWFRTGAGNDTLVGGQLGDSFTAGDGDDAIYGLGGNDWMYGGLGADDLRGGAGVDRYIYQAATESTTAGRDHILDFQSMVDRLDLSAIDANGNAGDGNSAFTFIGAGTFTNSAGQLRAYQSGGSWFVEGDVNGDGTADLSIELTMIGAAPLLQSDIVL